MKTLGSIVLAIGAVALLLFVLIVIPADRRGDEACTLAMQETSVAASPVVRAARAECDEHRRHETPMRVLGIVIFLGFVAGMVMYKRGVRDAMTRAA